MATNDAKPRPSAVQRGRKCPICGVRFAFDHTHTNCPECGALLGNIFAAKTTVKPVSKHRISLKEIARISGRVGGVTAAAVAAGAFVCTLLAFLVAPLFGDSVRIFVFAAAYFGGLIGFFVGLLWVLLDFVELYLVWGFVAGIVTGAFSGVVNFFVLNRGGYLPEVTLGEHALIGVIAGAVAGLFIGTYKTED